VDAEYTVDLFLSTLLTLDCRGVYYALTNKGATMKTRLYLIEEIATKKTRLIEAANAAQAMKHVAETTHTCAVVTSTSEAARLVSGGIKVESAGKGDAV
jgi:hypothetical protein